MKIDREGAKTWSETAKNVVSIVGVFVAAYWALFLFGKKDAPILEPRSKSAYSLQWSNVGDSCKASLRVDLDNIGAASFNISKVHVRAWTFEKIEQSNGPPVYFELNDVRRKGPPFFERTYNTADPITFVRRFPPQSGTGHTFEWIFTRQPNQWVYFEVDMYKPADEQPETYVGTWDHICGV